LLISFIPTEGIDNGIYFTMGKLFGIKKNNETSIDVYTDMEGDSSKGYTSFND
jgi:hypothetical protein